jgi:hypothetical protein
MRRREFLKLSSSLVGGAALAGCSAAATAPPKHPGTTGSGGPHPETTGTTRTTTTTTSPKRPGDFAALSRSMRGELVLPSSPTYALDAQSYNPVFNGAHPLAIAYVESAGDVVQVIGYGTDHGVPLSIRSGGHCYGGWSTGPGLVIDVSRLSQVTVAPGPGTATAGTGTRLVDFYNALAGSGVAVPGGSCPSVGLAGLALGGGLGVIDRKFGLTSDNMVSAEVVLASGEIVRCSSTEHPDLFWALRGAGGGNFGVVTSLEMRTHAIGDLALFTLVWPWSAAERAVAAWQSWAPPGPDELWSNCLLLASQNTPSGEAPVARVTGVFVGTEAALQSEVDDLVSAVGSAPFTRFVGSAGYLDTMLIEAGCEGDTVAECHLPNEGGILGRAPFAAKSDFVTKPLPSAGIAGVLAAVEARQASPVLSGGGIALDASGGAINRVSPGATAFVHRNALFSMQYSANWNDGSPASLVQANHAWLQSAWQSMRPYVSGEAYQNYADPGLADWAAAYYGTNLSRLQQVKARYDPSDVWHFPQSIPLPS